MRCVTCVRVCGSVYVSMHGLGFERGQLVDSDKEGRHTRCLVIECNELASYIPKYLQRWRVTYRSKCANTTCLSLVSFPDRLSSACIAPSMTCGTKIDPCWGWLGLGLRLAFLFTMDIRSRNYTYCI